MPEKAITLLLFFVWVSSVWAAKYEVRSGDTLWGIAERFYGDPYCWIFIWESNRDRVRNPHWIYPGQELIIPERVRREVKPSYPLKEIKKPIFHWEQQVFIPRVVEYLPKVVGLISGEAFDPDKSLYSEGDFVNVEVKGHMASGDILLVYKLVDSVLRDPVSGENLGVLIKNVGLLKVVEITGNVALAKVLRSDESLVAGYFLTPFKMPEPIYSLRDVRGISGRVVSLGEERTAAGLNDFVVVNVGNNNGISIGDRLYVISSLWRKRVAELAVVDSGKKASTCVVLRTERPVMVGQEVE